jgi:hypothetical protein
MPTPPEPALRYLWHPGTEDTFSGYGLALTPAHLVGVVMIDRPEPADPAWLAALAETFGRYELTTMTQSGERGLVCQMHIAAESVSYLKALDSPMTEAIRAALLPLLEELPLVTLSLTWYPWRTFWVSNIIRPRASLFPLGQVVATPGALRALERAEQSPIEFLDRHAQGDWGELDAEDKGENAFSVRHGFRILSAYTTSAGDKLWIITEADRSVTTLLLPEEY